MHWLHRAGKAACQVRLARVSNRPSFARAFATASPQLPQLGTKVEKLIQDTIKATGPISFSEYMWLCLAHPTEGYYTKPLHEVLGARGDFITSPEISQVFGELIAIWLLSQWLASGKAGPVRIVELGPGTGTMMDDLLRVLSQFPASKSAVKEIHLVETSRTLRLLQEKRLDPVAKRNGWTLCWHDSIDDVPRDDTHYTMLVAHEFFDALPFHLIEKTAKGWQEVLITSAPDPSAPTIIIPSNSSVTQAMATPSHFRHVLAPEPSAKSILLGSSSPRFNTLPIGSRVEASPVSYRLARKIAELLSAKDDNKRAGGSALIIDYGDDRAYGNSFRAFKDHKIVDVFNTPGDCDLTVNVDFAYLKEAMGDLVTTHGSISQADFLTRMGIQVRAEALKRSAREETRKLDIDKSAKRLVDLTGMGNQYRFLGITSGTDPSTLPLEGVWPFVPAKVNLGD